MAEIKNESENSSAAQNATTRSENTPKVRAENILLEIIPKF